ncbi:MAG: cyclic pyranopterin monophosphate synthase MoaC [Spirochaetales bacterium]|nr:cyclic pyranopterin monophosphate synthase MoaC [Spirochaetales bacterium]
MDDKNKNLSHIDDNGNAIMVDVSEKDISKRKAVASGRIKMSRECFKTIQSGNNKKGDVLGVAQVAGIMGAKKTSELIPLCHILNLTNCKLDFKEYPEISEIEAICTVKCNGKTGVEMEALTGVSTALLTIYDMCKAIDKTMEINNIHLEEKTGGKSGTFKRS